MGSADECVAPGEAPAPRDSLNFRLTSLLSRNEFESGTESGTFASFTYVSVIYGANFPFKISLKGSFEPKLSIGAESSLKWRN